MYGLWLFKEIKTEYGYCKVDIFRKGYSGSQIEIGALAANSLTISLENLSEIISPVGKSVCSFEIIDTEQIAYDDFFTPDATYYKVVVSTKVGAGAYVTRWSGYITPDFFAENLTYRTPISISARDNIGYLNDVDFDLTASSITVRELIQSAFRKIAADYPMSLSFVSHKQTAEGILAIDATISTLLLKEMSWGEALETILHDLGLQMRWVDNNTIAVLDLSQIPEYYPTQAFNFIHSSGYREIAPAWRRLSQSQDYGLRENFFEGNITSRNVSFVKEEVITTSGPIFSGSNQTRIKYYTPKNWISAGAMYTINPADFVNGNELFKGRIYFTGILSNSVDYSGNYMSWRQPVVKSDWPMRIQFNASNAVFAPGSWGIGLFPPTLFGSSNDRYQLGLKVNVLLHSGTNTYVLRQEWELLSGEETDTIRFILPEITSNSTAQEEELTIDVNRIPYDGDLEFRIYGFYLNPEYDSNVGIPEGSLVKMVSYISDVTYTYETKVIPTGQDTAVQINELHNVKGSQDYTFGEVPLDRGGINAYAGGLFKADGSELYGFQRDADGVKYNLLELVGREIIHFNKDNYNRLSGTIKNLDKEPLMFNRLFVREGKTYYPYNGSLNVISNEMNITAMQEVEPYTTASFAEINSEVVTGGATVGAGNNTVLQYSEEAGNAKRVYDLDTATEEEKKDAYVLIDNAGFPQARKVHISELIDNKLFTFDEETQTVRTKYNLVIEKAITFGKGKQSEEGEGSGSQVGITTFDVYVGTDGPYTLKDGKVKLPAYPTVPKTLPNPFKLTINGTSYDGSAPVNIEVKAGVDDAQLLEYAKKEWVTEQGYIKEIPSDVITEDELRSKGYATEKWVNSQGFLTAHQSLIHLLSKEEAADTYQPKGDYAVLDDLNSYLLISAAKNTYATKTALNNAIQAHDELREEFDALNGLLTDDTSGYIDTWNEVKSFLDGYSESQDLATILSGINKDIANRATIEALNGATARINTLETTLSTEQGYIDTLQGYFTSGKAKRAIADGNGNNIVDTYATKAALKDVADKVTTLQDMWFFDEAHANTIRTLYNVVVDKAISFGGYGESSGSGGGITTVTKQMVLDALGYTPYDAANPKGYITSSVLNGYATQTWVENQGYLTNTSLSSYVDLASAQDITGIKTFVNGVKIGSTLFSEKTNNNTKYVELDGNLVVKGSISFGGAGESSGNGGGITTVTKDMVIDALGYTPYSATNPNGYITSSAIPTSLKNPYSLTINNSAGTAQVSYDGSATKSLTLTKSMIGLGNVQNTAVYTRELGVNGVNWTFASTYYTTDNKSTSIYAPTSAGTAGQYLVSNGSGAPYWITIDPYDYNNIRNANTVLAAPNGSSGNATFRKLVSADIPSLDWSKITSGKPTTLGGYGINDAYTKTAADSAFLGINTLGIDADGVTNLNKVGYGYATGGWYASGPALAFGSTNGYTALIQQGTSTHTLYVSYKSNGGSIKSWKEIAFTDSDITGNAASATKLQTSRTLWGQSFDGSKNVTGSLFYVLNINPDTAHNYSCGASDKPWKVVYTRYIDTYTGYDLRFRTGGTEQMRLAAASGCLILGDSNVSENSAYKLDVRGVVRAINSSDGSGVIIANQGNTIDGYYNGWGNLYLNYTSSGNVNLAVGGGNVGIGTRDPSSKLHVVGNIVTTGSITFGSASDRRLKDNIQSMTDKQAIAVLSALNPVTFKWNTTAYELGKLSGVSDGFIADEYEKLIPNSGRDIWANYRAINYERATGYLVKGWQNHETRLEKAERRIKELENELKQYRRA